MAELPSHRSSEFIRSLRGREEAARGFHGVRKRMMARNWTQLSLDDLVGLHHPAVNSVILGFSADGEHLVAYSCESQSADGAGHLQTEEGVTYFLEFWRLAFNKPLVLVAKLGLFRCRDGDKFSTSDFLQTFPAMPASIKVFETRCPSMMVVSGSEGRALCSGEQGSRRESLSLLGRAPFSVRTHPLHWLWSVGPLSGHSQ
mmetsp:Transcript_22096/g.34652  ORF Transcript_22096/g.34652 Transcript_22096/m.34652 type:complete len:201 (+) Transcript_22096:43-645(+)